MPAEPTLALKPTVRLLEERGEPVGLEEPGRKRVRFPDGQGGLLRALQGGRATEAELCGAPGSRERRYLLALLEKEGWLTYALGWEGRALATLEPLTPAFRFRSVPVQGSWRLSRFAWLRRLESGPLVLEAPLGLGRVVLHEPALLPLVGHLGQTRDARALAERCPLPPPVVHACLALLAAAGAVVPCPGGGPSAEDEDPMLRPWEFHDLLFHSRSRQGRHAEPVGGTFRFLGELPPLPALKPGRPEPGIPLPEPGPSRPDPAFFAVLDARRSIRAPRGEPVTLAQLGTFLHYVARVRRVAPPGPGRPYEAAIGPCPGGGALHELELYLSVSRCRGLEPGFYHYDAGRHRLEPWPGPAGAAGDLLRQAREAMGAEAAPDLLITLAARAQRVAWKYQTIAYALILKNTGVVLQQMYLVATALGLAPCAIGVGDTQAFARASGLPFTQESSVGEFALSG